MVCPGSLLVLAAVALAGLHCVRSDEEVIATAGGRSPAEVLALLGVESAGAQHQGERRAPADSDAVQPARNVQWRGQPPAATDDDSAADSSTPPAPPRRRPPRPDTWGPIRSHIRPVLELLLPADAVSEVLASRKASVSALATAQRQIPAVTDQYDLADEEPLLKSLMALIPAAVSLPEPAVAYEAMHILDKRLTDRPGAPAAYRAQVAAMWTELSTLLTRDASLRTADLCRWLGAERRARLPPEFEDPHRLGFGYWLPGSDTAEHTLSHRRLPARRNHLPELSTLVSSAYLSSTSLLLARTFLQYAAGERQWEVGKRVFCASFW